MLDAKSRFNLQPRLLIAPGFSARQPVATAIDGLADKLSAVSLIEGPNTTDAAALAYARNFGSKRLTTKGIASVFNGIPIRLKCEPVSKLAEGVTNKTASNCSDTRPRFSGCL